jgi:hypothetical protein
MLSILTQWNTKEAYIIAYKVGVNLIYINVNEHARARA